MSGYMNQGEGVAARAASDSIDWCTPMWVIEGVRKALGGIDLDPCANLGSLGRINAPCNYYLPNNGDGLTWPWGGVDPYETTIMKDGRWVGGVLAPAPRVPMPFGQSGFPDWRSVQRGYSNPPFGGYYIHAETKEILVPKDFNALAEKLVDGNPQTAADGEFRRTKADFLKAVARKKKDLLDSGWERHTIAEWVEKASREADKHDLDWIHLGPAAVDTAYWHNIVEKEAAAVCFIKGRLKFELVDFTTLKVIKSGNAAPMPCALVLWTKQRKTLLNFAAAFRDRGAVHELQCGRELLAGSGV